MKNCENFKCIVCVHKPFIYGFGTKTLRSMVGFVFSSKTILSYLYSIANYCRLPMFVNKFIHNSDLMTIFLEFLIYITNFKVFNLYKMTLFAHASFYFIFTFLALYIVIFFPSILCFWIFYGLDHHWSTLDWLILTIFGLIGWYWAWFHYRYFKLFIQCNPLVHGLIRWDYTVFWSTTCDCPTSKALSPQMVSPIHWLL